MAALPAASELRPVTRRHPCPVCGKPDWCLASPDGTRVLCMRQPSNRPHPKSGGWWHNREDRDTRPREAAPVAPIRSAAPLADPDRLHDAYTALLHHPAFALRAAHRGNLLGRGLDAAAIAANGYATMPADYHSRTKALRDVAERVGDLSGIPGAYVNANRYGRYPALAGAAGILVPVRDYTGRIRRNQVRPDRRPKNGGKYQWVSSANREGGTGSGAPLHWTLAGDPAGVLYVVEGPLKADLVAHFTGCRALGFPGAHPGQALRIREELEAARWDRSRPLVLAPDQDYRTKPNVLRAWVAIGTHLAEHGYRVEVACWPTNASGEPKGPDDALQAGAAFSVTSWNTWAGAETPNVRRRGASLVRPRPAHEVAADALAEPEALPRAEAEAALTECIREHLRERPAGVLVVAATLGLGKSHVAARELAALWADGWPTVKKRNGEERPLRVAYLTPTKALAAETLARLQEFGAPALFLEGRTPENCPRFADVKRLGARRHSPARELCNCDDGCPHAAECAYCATRDQAREAPLVVGALDVVLANAKDAATFDLFVLDEGLSAQHLVPSFVLDTARVGAWLDGMDREDVPEDAATWRLARALQRALALGGDHWGSEFPPQAHAVPRLAQVAQALGVDLAELVAKLVAEGPPEGGRYPWESPWDLKTAHGSVLHGEERMPLRGFWDLVELLAAEVGPGAACGSDTRLWLRLLQPEGVQAGDRVPCELVVYRPADCLAVLPKRATLWLDASPDRWALGRLFGDRVRYHVIRAEERLRVVQFTDALRPSDRAREAVRDRLREDFPGRAGVITRKRLRQEDAEAGLVAGHFGANHRGSNEFFGCAALAVEGHFSPPANEAEAFVEAVRFGRPNGGPAEDFAPFLGTDQEGRLAGAGATTDPDVLRWVNEQWGRDVRQAAGRLRACRWEEPEPLLVVLECRVPVPGLRVDEVTTAREWLGWKDHDADRMRGVIEARLRSAREAEERVGSAVVVFRQRNGRLPTADNLTRLAGCRKVTACRVLAETRGALSRAVPPVEDRTCTYARHVEPAGIRTPAPPGRLPTPPPRVPTRAPASGAGSAPQAHAGGAYTPSPRYTEPLPAAVPPALLAQWEAALGPPGASPPQLWADGAGGILGAGPPPAGTRGEGAATWAA